MTTRAIIWCAVSTEEQAKKDSLPQQKADAEAYCQQQGWQIVDTLTVDGHSREYVEYSHAAAEMEAYRSLRAHFTARDFDVLVCRALDRLGRTQALIHQIAAYCQQASARIHCLTMPLTGDPGSDNLLIAWGGVIAGNELREFRRRHDKGMDGRLYAGKPLSATLPFPYYRTMDPDTGKPSGAALLDPRGKEAIRECYRMLQRGHTQEDCARYLNALGFTSQRGNPWYSGNVVIVLRNPFLMGTLTRHAQRSVHVGPGKEVRNVHQPRSEWKTHTGKHEPVFIPEEFADLQRYVARKPRGRPTGSKVGIFSGLLRCAYCGSRMYVNTSVRRGRWNYIAVTYICGNYKVRRCAHANYIGQRHLSRLLLPVLQRWLAEAATHATHEPDLPELPDYSSELADINKREKAIALLFETGRISLALYDERLRELNAMRAVLDEKITTARTAREQAERAQQGRRAVTELLPHLPRLLKEMPPGESNASLRALLPQFVIRDKAIVDVR